MEAKPGREIRRPCDKPPCAGLWRGQCHIIQSQGDSDGETVNTGSLAEARKEGMEDKASEVLFLATLIQRNGNGHVQ